MIIVVLKAILFSSRVLRVNVTSSVLLNSSLPPSLSPRSWRCRQMRADEQVMIMTVAPVMAIASSNEATVADKFFLVPLFFPPSFHPFNLVASRHL